MKLYIPLLIAALLLSGCSDSEEAAPVVTKSVPTSCEETAILAAFPTKIPDPRYIPTQWEPAEGTDLKAAIDSGGIACSYGIQEAEVGATILWSPGGESLFDERALEWESSGHKAIDLPDLTETKAYVLTEGKEGEGEFHVWAINLLIDGVWIAVNATFFGSIEEAIPVVRAAVDSLI